MSRHVRYHVLISNVQYATQKWFSAQLKINFIELQCSLENAQMYFITRLLLKNTYVCILYILIISHSSMFENGNLVYSHPIHFRIVQRSIVSLIN